jgi:hypothetical protein
MIVRPAEPYPTSANPCTSVTVTFFSGADRGGKRQQNP